MILKHPQPEPFPWLHHHLDLWWFFQLEATGEMVKSKGYQKR